MTIRLPIFAAASALAIASAPAFAQTDIFDAQDRAQDAVEDLHEAIDDAMDRDLRAFGNVGRQVGFEGSFALQGNVTSGNTDTANLGIGTTLGYYDGVNGYDLALSYAYTEEDGDSGANRLLYGLKYTRDFGPRWYGYATLQGSNDNSDDASFSRDTFLGVGVGYKVIERADLQWNIAAGPGYRWAQPLDGSGTAQPEIKEEAISLTSNYTARISDTVLGTMDTNVIWSDSDTVIYNDAGINVSLGGALALRTALVSEYHSSPAPGKKDLDNSFGVSLVYSFN